MMGFYLMAGAKPNRNQSILYEVKYCGVHFHRSCSELEARHNFLLAADARCLDCSIIPGNIFVFLVYFSHLVL